MCTPSWPPTSGLLSRFYLFIYFCSSYIVFLGLVPAWICDLVFSVIKFGMFLAIVQIFLLCSLSLLLLVF